jgi:hypothetical protein
MDKLTIQSFIKEHYGKLTNEEMALSLNESRRNIGANIVALKRKKELSDDIIKFSDFNIVVNHYNSVINKFSNKCGDEKEKTRIKIKTAIENSGVGFDNPIVSLPFEDLKMELKLLSEVSKKFKFIGCERDKQTYKNMLTNIVKNDLTINTYFGNIGDLLITRKTNSISHLILDYCGQFGMHYKDIQYTMENDLVEVNGIIALTFNNRISIGTEYIYNLMEKLNPRTDVDDDKRVIHSIKTFINRIGGLKYAIEEVFKYKDKEKASMVLVIIKRVG